MKFIQKHKRLLIIVLIALIIIATAYYFTLGKPSGQTTTSTTGGSDSGSGNSNTTPSGGSFAPSTFPLRWGVYNSNTRQLQARLNLSITSCKLGSIIAEDGILGAQTVAAIKQSFPNIGASVEANRQVSQDQYSIIINSKPSCI